MGFGHRIVIHHYLASSHRISSIHRSSFASFLSSCIRPIRPRPWPRVVVLFWWMGCLPFACLPAAACLALPCLRACLPCVAAWVRCACGAPELRACGWSAVGGGIGGGWGFRMDERPTNASCRPSPSCPLASSRCFPSACPSLLISPDSWSRVVLIVLLMVTCHSWWTRTGTGS